MGLVPSQPRPTLLKPKAAEFGCSRLSDLSDFFFFFLLLFFFQGFHCERRIPRSCS